MRPSALARTATGLAGLALLAACGREEAPADSASAADGPRSESPASSAESPSEGAAGPWFVDATARTGVDFVHDAGFSEAKHLPETMGAGAALSDLDGDGDLDLYLVQSGPFPPRAGGPPNRTFLAEEPMAYRDVTAASGDAAHAGYGMGVSAGDVDGDGRTDLFVTNFGADALLLQGDALAFREVRDSPAADPRWTAGSTLFDADADGDLDLYVTAYVEIDVEDPAWCGRQEPGWRSYCHPDHYPGLADRFYRNDGRGGLLDATREAGLVGNDGKGLGAVAADFDADGDLDLYVANDSVENRFWTNRGDGTFEDDTLLSGTGVNGRGATEAGMGIAVGDVDLDRDLDLFVTNFDEESNTLYRNDGNGLFTDVTASAGLDAPSRLPVGFGTVIEDLDLDGLLDLAVGNGHIIDNIHRYHDGKSWAQAALLFAGRDSGRFEFVPGLAGPLAEPVVARGLYAGDLDGDGDADLVLTECGGPAKVFENVAAAGRAFTLELGGAAARATLVTVFTTRAATGERRAHLRSTAQPVSYFGSGSSLVRVGLRAGERVSGVELVLPAGERAVAEAGEPLGPGSWRLTGTADALVLAPAR